jgi:hypothetical protein
MAKAPTKPLLKSLQIAYFSVSPETQKTLKTF